MRVLDLFSGLGGFSQAFFDRGHEVVRVDIDPFFKPDVVADVRRLRYPSLPPLDKAFDVVLASPPCEMFSLARAWHGWPPEGQRDSLGVVASMFRLISEVRPAWFVVENPRGFLRRFIGPPRQTIRLCNFGGEFMKPTDLWGRWPNGRLPDPRPCALHAKSANGVVSIKNPYGLKGVGGFVAATSGFTKDSKALRSKLPYGLGLELCRRMDCVFSTTSSEKAVL